MLTILTKSLHDNDVNVLCSLFVLYNWSPSTITYSRSSDDHSKIGVKDEQHTLYKLKQLPWILRFTQFSVVLTKRSLTAMLYSPAFF